VASYRFCRSDDWALLARAHETCVRPHAPELPILGVGELKLAAREIQLWAGNCMVALEAGEPIGVLLACKRETEVLVWRIGVRLDRLRQAHGRHLLTSLRNKLAILGPRRIVVELPESVMSARALLESCGYTREGEWLDLVLERRVGSTVSNDLLVPVTVDDLVAGDALAKEAPRAWERSLPTLLSSKARLHALAVAPAERIEAFVVWQDMPDERRILALACADRERATVWLDLLVSHVAAGAPRAVRLYRVGAAEFSLADLEGLGFVRREVTLRYGLAIEKVLDSDSKK
jgi:hypothetical protein